MSRVQLSGEGFPIPAEALPDANTGGDIPPTTLLLPPGDFLKAEMMALGYTHYEVTCIGAVGGMGGRIKFSGSWSYGGGGGGGGLHRVDGLLADLPDICPVIVGEAGAAGREGNDAPVYRPRINPATGLLYVPHIWDPNPAYIPPLVGSDGGASSFNGALCRASGGKGGAPTPVAYINGDYTPTPGEANPDPLILYYPRLPGGNGGEGGMGDSDVAGGGGMGAFSDYVYQDMPSHYDHAVLTIAEDGLWDSIVGYGGGGGRGGTFFQVSEPLVEQVLEDASSGGQGSFSYTDTSVYGPRQSKQNSSSDYMAKPIVPGSGGGAKLGKTAHYGSRAPGANPNGVVQIRFVKIT